MHIYKGSGRNRERERVGKQFYILQPLHHNITQNWENLRTSKLLSSSSPSGWASPTWERPQHPAGPASGPQKPHDVRRAGAALGPRAGALDGEIIGKSWELQGTCAIFLKYGLNIWRNFARWLNRDLLVWKCERHLENHGARSCINHSICGQKADNSCLMNIRAKRISKETKKMSHGNKMLCRAHGKKKMTKWKICTQPNFYSIWLSVWLMSRSFQAPLNSASRPWHLRREKRS